MAQMSQRGDAGGKRLMLCYISIGTQNTEYRQLSDVVRGEKLDKLGRLAEVDRDSACHLAVAAEVSDHLSLGRLAG